MDSMLGWGEEHTSMDRGVDPCLSCCCPLKYRPVPWAAATIWSMLAPLISRSVNQMIILCINLWIYITSLFARLIHPCCMCNAHTATLPAQWYIDSVIGGSLCIVVFSSGLIIVYVLLSHTYISSAMLSFASHIISKVLTLCGSPQWTRRLEGCQLFLRHCLCAPTTRTISGLRPSLCKGLVLRLVRRC